ncbi:hypothetical protein VIBHAR_02057 [Vibrio campbellii ATCC BAA-1116]|uniref:Uncharacterized protein n=1 Tax=Vibrio campbellii (strain ATCC BAA-1116) TaxID=2902295 RepID=A7N019_VIBC1|nr:hypothetical protein VIBHAR_02057 [Vibrio campbellii ATCC BAA-1116]
MVNITVLAKLATTSPKSMFAYSTKANCKCVSAWRKKQVNKNKSTELIFKGAFLRGAFLIPPQHLPD